MIPFKRMETQSLVLFIEKTVYEISDRSIWVSHSGDKWIFDNRSKLSKMESF